MHIRHDQLAKGVDVEQEHADLYKFLVSMYPDLPRRLDLKDFALWIARAHLKEIEDYYDWLGSMEYSAKLYAKKRG